LTGEDRVLIGDFARATGLTIKALRHYDAVGLLSAGTVDLVSGYRYYSRAQQPTAQTIGYLRELGISIDEIRKAIAGGPEGLRATLVRHRRRLEARQQKNGFAIHKLDRLLKGGEMSRGKPYPASADDDLALGKWCYNRTWELIEAEDRTPEDNEEMLTTAFAARFHWSRVGTAANASRAEWQLARVYGLLGNHTESLSHSRRCLQITEAGHLQDFDLAFAYEGMARSLALAGELEEARRFADRAAAAGAQVADDEDKQIFMSDFSTLPLTRRGEPAQLPN
jgi:DNA-binding transcriptional MerR regulator